MPEKNCTPIMSASGWRSATTLISSSLSSPNWLPLVSRSSSGTRRLKSPAARTICRYCRTDSTVSMPSKPGSATRARMNASGLYTPEITAWREGRPAAWQTRHSPGEQISKRSTRGAISRARNGLAFTA